MLIAALAYLAGVLTILSPCILPVLPFVFARAGRPFLTSTLPMLAGLVLGFAGVASLAAVGGAWAVDANEWGRRIAMAVLVLFGLMLLSPALSERLTRPVVALGARLQGRQSDSVAGAVVLGLATGLLWAPCAGPVLGLILTGAALNGANAGTTLLLVAYAAGAATALALAMGIGGRVYAAMKASGGVSAGLRRGAGALVLVSVAAIALGLDTGVLTRLSSTGTNRVEQALMRWITPEASPVAMSPVAVAPAPGPAMMAPGPAMMAPGPAMMAPGPAMMAPDPSAAMMAPDPNSAMMAAGGGVPVPDPAAASITPSLAGVTGWLNSPALDLESLRGKVVLIDFWTYSCINCLRAIPHVRAWADRYTADGLVVIGVHSPEFAFEKRLANVEAATRDLGISYPVAIDNDYAVWRAFQNRYWPAHYLIDAEGRLRYHHFGEGNYDQTEETIRSLLAEAGAAELAGVRAAVSAEGASAPADMAQVQSPETYLGYLRARNFLGEGGLVIDGTHRYTPEEPRRNEWSLGGLWTARPEFSALEEAGGTLTFRFRARDLHLVMGPGPDGEPVRFTVTIDGEAPGADHGLDLDAEGQGVVTEERLYQLIRQQGDIRDRTFEIRFLDRGVEAYAFTFG